MGCGRAHEASQSGVRAPCGSLGEGSASLGFEACVAHGLILGGGVHEELLHVPVEDGAEVGVDAQREDRLVVTRACLVRGGGAHALACADGQCGDRSSPEQAAGLP